MPKIVPKMLTTTDILYSNVSKLFNKFCKSCKIECHMLTVVDLNNPHFPKWIRNTHQFYSCCKSTFSSVVFFCQSVLHARKAVPGCVVFFKFSHHFESKTLCSENHFYHNSEVKLRSVENYRNSLIYANLSIHLKHFNYFSKKNNKM